MVGVSQIEIRESREPLKVLMREQVTIQGRERIHSLYLLKSQEACDVSHAAQTHCRSRVTLQRWLKKYQLGGIAQLIAPPSGQGRAAVKPIAMVEWSRKAIWLYGVVAPATGDSFFFEYSHLNGACFEHFLQLVGDQFPQFLNVIQVDGAPAHIA